MAHFLWRAMSILCYRREQGSMETLSDESHQEALERRGCEYLGISRHRVEDKGRKAAANQERRTAETNDGKATLLG